MKRTIVQKRFAATATFYGIGGLAVIGHFVAVNCVDWETHGLVRDNVISSASEK